jgi:Tol biopolymer transport system component
MVTRRTNDRFRARRDVQDDIYVMNADGSGIRNLTQTRGAEEWGPNWTPDGRVVFNTDSFSDGPTMQIAVMSVDGGDIRVVSRRTVNTRRFRPTARTSRLPPSDGTRWA